DLRWRRASASPRGAGPARGRRDRNDPKRQPVHHSAVRPEAVLSRRRGAQRAGAAWSGPVTMLAELGVGTRGRVHSVAGDDELCARLLEMGLTPGVEVAVIGAAPLG